VYRYRCERCATTSPTVATRGGALAEQDHHRAVAHGGHIPDGDHIRRLPRQPSPADRRTLLLAALVFSLPALDWLARHAT
jgi:hypothetical protein